ncbi:MAG: twin-arginine translocase TatA/TatE family subunit [Candidatus Hydrogenedentota bacterium]
MNLGWQELILIVLIVLLLFGAKRVPEIFRSLGSGVGEFKKGLKDGETAAGEQKRSDHTEN